jgi:hypothetical protein
LARSFREFSLVSGPGVVCESGWVSSGRLPSVVVKGAFTTLPVS